MNPTDLLTRLRDVLGPCESFTPLHIPIFDEQEVAYLRECVESNFVSSVGAFVDRFEEALAAFTGAKRAVVCVNGTSALHLALRLAGVEPGDEVLIPSLSFVATANAVSYAGAVPHFVECELGHFGVDVGKIEDYILKIEDRRLKIEDGRGKIEDGRGERKNGGIINKVTGRRIRALVPMHVFGHPVDVEGCQRVCEQFGLALVEDAAESLGSFYGGRHMGTFGTCGVLSFNGNKVITTGGGGALLFNDDELADKAKYLSTTAKRPHRWEFFHDEIGYNYRMPALNAAMGVAQMEKLPRFLEQKRVLANRYAEAFADVEGIRFVTEPDGCRSNYWLNALVLEENAPVTRDELLEATNSNNIMTRPIWVPLHKLPMYADCPRMELPVTEDLEKRVVNVPSSAHLAG
jgi:perosamine synthetase